MPYAITSRNPNLFTAISFQLASEMTVELIVSYRNFITSAIVKSLGVSSKMPQCSNMTGLTQNKTFIEASDDGLIFVG